jgi:hypothetical protein
VEREERESGKREKEKNERKFGGRNVGVAGLVATVR